MIGFDVPANSIYEIKAGKRTIVDYEICAIAKVLKISVNNILNYYYNSLDSV